MTMPTSLPRRFMEVRFPADFVAQYTTPLSYFNEGSRGGSAVMANPSTSSTPGFGIYAPGYMPEDGFETSNQIWHKQKALDRANQVATQVRNLQIQRMNQMTHMPYSQMAGSGDEMCGGARYGGTPTTIEGARVLAGRGLRGGVMRTLAGHQYVEGRLKSRVNELNIRDAVAGEIAMPQIPKSQPASEDDNSVKSLGEFMDILDDSFTSGAIESDTVVAARGVLNNLLKVGWRIPQNLLTPLLRQVNEMLNNINQVSGATQQAYALNAEKKKRLRTVFLILERSRTVLEDLSQNSDLSPEERRMRLGALQGALQQQVQAQSARIPRNRAVPPLQPGLQNEVFPYLPANPNLGLPEEMNRRRR
jgi:hypothetical protein